MSKSRAIGRKIAQAVAAKKAIKERAMFITGQQDITNELDILKTPPKNRTEAKKHLAIKLRLLRSGALDMKSLQEIEVESARDLSSANARRFEEGIVQPVTTDRIPTNKKKWRGKTAD